MTQADPAQDELIALHDALLDGHPTVSARLAELLLPALRRRFRGRREIGHAEIESQIGLSIAVYLAEPQRYDPERGPLLAFLYRDVDGDIRNEAAKRTRRRESLAAGETIELLSAAGNFLVEDEVVQRSELADALALVTRLGAEEKELLRLRVDGVRSTHAYAEVLGIAHLPVEQQRLEVKRAKDRLDKKLERMRDRISR